MNNENTNERQATPRTLVYCSFLSAEELQKLIPLCLAVMNEPKKEALTEIANTVKVYCSPEEFIENKDGRSPRIAEMLLYTEVLPCLMRRSLNDGLKDAWKINHPKRELTDEEREELRRLDNEYLCSNMADGQAYFDEEPLRKSIEKRKRELLGTYDGSYGLGTRYAYEIKERRI